MGHVTNLFTDSCRPVRKQQTPTAPQAPRIHRKAHTCMVVVRVLPNAFALRSHVNGIVGTCANRQNTPQVPRIYVSTFPHRPAHAQTLNRIPRPLASPEVNKKTHCIEVKIMFFNLMKISTKWPRLQAERVWGPSDVTPWKLMGEQKKRCLLLGWRSHEPGMRPWNVVVESCEWPRFD